MACLNPSCPSYFRFLVHTRLSPAYLEGSCCTRSTAALICSGVASTFHFTLMMWMTVEDCAHAAAAENKHRKETSAPFISTMMPPAQKGRGYFPHQMPPVLFILEAVVIEHLRVRRKKAVQLHGPRLGVCLGIVDGNFDFQFPEIHPMEALRDGCCVREGAAVPVQPDPVVE